MRSIPVAILAVVLTSACGGGATQKPPESAESKSGGEEGPSSSFKPPGDCVDAASDGDRHDPTKPFDKHVQPDVRSDDLDGDGVVDVFVKPAWSCGDSCNRSVYIVRGTCAHYVGTFPSTDNFESTENKTNGLKDISTRPKRQGEDGQTHCFNEIWQFDGKEYKKAKHRECECKAEGAKCTAWGASE
ncbi:MAG: hypothetical protein ACXWUG_15175 [Polyangiales bacterium]